MMNDSSLTRPLFSADVVDLLNHQREAFQQIDAGSTIGQVLSKFAAKCEGLANATVHVTFLLLSSSSQRLQHVAPRTLPTQYRVAIEDTTGHATSVLPEPLGHEREVWYLRDIAQESRWPEWRAIALTNGLRGLWAAPILLSTGQFAGNVVCYFEQSKVLDAHDNGMLALIAQTAALVLDRHAAAHSMLAAHDRHRQIFNSATDFAIVATDFQGVVTDWNEGAYRVLGWTEEEALGFKLHRIFTPEDVACGRPEIEMQTTLQEGFSPDERWHLRKSGERFWAVGQMTPLKASDGEVIGFLKVLRDRTDQKLSETQRDAHAAGLETQVVERTRERDLIWKNSLDLLLEIDFEGVIKAINPAWTTALGYVESDLIGHYFEPFVHPDDIQATVKAIDTATKGPLEDFEVRLRHQDGSYRWVAWRAAAEAGMVYANGRDITYLKKQEEQLSQANEARLQLALDAGRMGVWEWNLHSDEIIWLHGSAGVHGLPASEGPLPMPLAGYLGYVHPDDQQVLAAIMTEALNSAKDAHAEYRVTWPDGSLHWLEARGFMIVDEQGAAVHMVGVSTDITERKRTESDLKFLANASAELAGLVDPTQTLQRLAYLAVPHFADWCTAFLLQEDGTIKQIALAHVDPEKVELAKRLHQQFPPEVNAPRGVWNVVRSGQVEYAREITNEMVEANTPQPEKLALLKTLGLRSYVTAPLRVHSKVIGAVSFIAAESGRLYDDKDIKMAEDLAQRAAIAIDNANLYRTLEQSDKGKSVFLATLSHELRNPLAAITNGLSLMRLVIDDKKRVEQTMTLMYRQANQLTRLVDDLMDVSRIATGKVVLQKRIISLANVLADAVESTRLGVEANRHTLSLHLPGEPSELSADPARLLEVFSNLLSNAARYTNAGGRIDVTLERSDDEYLVRVRDTGIGIAAEMLPKVFNLFTQVVHPVQRSQGGLGIGLSLVDGLVKLHGGRVEAFSAGLGHGSEFVVHLPGAATRTSEVELIDTDTPSLSMRKKFLVVDDNQDAAVTLAELLRMLDQDVELAYDGLSAVSTAQAVHPDIVILDIGLPGIDGYEAARRILASSTKNRPVLIALTGWGEEGDKQQAREAGFDAHLLKPVEFARLTELLQEFESKRPVPEA